MTTLRKELTAAGFGWNTGKIVCQIPKEISRLNSWPEDYNYFGFIELDDPVLDLEYNDGFRGSECPLFIANDKHYLYISGVYDGSTWVEKIKGKADLEHYTIPGVRIPMIGGE